LVLILVFAYQWWTGDERAIKARLDSLAVALSPAQGGELAMVTRVAGLRNYFAPDIRVRLGVEEILSRDTLLGLLGRMSPSEDFKVQFAEVVVTIGDGGTAQVSLVARISSRDLRDGEPTGDERDATLTMRKLDGAWVIAAVESTNAMQRR